MEEGVPTVTSATSASRTSNSSPLRTSPSPATSAQSRTNGTVVFASPAQVKQLNVVPSSSTQALAVQQPGGGVSIVHVSIPNQPMHVQSVIQPTQQSVIQAAGGAATLQTLGKNVILVNKGSVIHSADGEAGVHPVQLIPASKLESCAGEVLAMAGEEESKKRREILARRPSYRKILNDLSSTEAQGAVASLAADSKEEHEEDADNGTITVSGTQYHTTAGLIKVVPASAIQLAVTQDGGIGGLQTLTMTNAGSGTAGTIVQYAQGQDGQFFVPVNVSAADLQAYQIRTTSATGLSAQSVVMAPAGSLQTQQSLAEEASRKRELRLLKNRDAAKECRRKKKEYIKCLENRVAVLENQNKALIDELKSLKELYCQKNE